MAVISAGKRSLPQATLRHPLNSGYSSGNWCYISGMTIEELVPEVLKLPSRERALLACSLWESLEDPYDLTPRSDEDSISLAWQRDAELEAGVVLPLSHAELMQQLRA